MGNDFGQQSLREDMRKQRKSDSSPATGHVLAVPHGYGSNLLLQSRMSPGSAAFAFETLPSARASLHR